MNSKIQKILQQIKKNNLDGLILSSPYNITYLTGHRSRDSYLLVSKKSNIFFTDSRYFEEAKSKLKHLSIVKTNGSVFKIIADYCRNLKLKAIGVEEGFLNLREYGQINHALAGKATLVSVNNLVEALRALKSTQEIELIRQASAITIKALNYIKDFIVAGVKEIEVAGELERFIRNNGATGSAFEIIVASGPNSAFAHHLTSSKKIKHNELVLIDIGVEYRGYKSDLTRVFMSGKINSYARKVYDIVLAAGRLAIAKIKPGVGANEIDAAARHFIAQKGFNGFFGHALGHGVGLEVHEEPRISKQNNTLLKAGMVFTIEPAIYLPGKFGIRIEDMVLVTPKGCEVLSGALDK